MQNNRPRRLLKFSYIFCLICLLGCRDNPASKGEKNGATVPVEETTAAAESEANTSETILFFGDSLTAGLGLGPNLALVAKRPPVEKTDSDGS